ncbi:MAG: hypothetical protein ACOYOP_07030 [Microthrixaceae bacterium]
MPPTTTRRTATLLLLAAALTATGCSGGQAANGSERSTTTTEVRMVMASDIPVAHTPPGFWIEFPDPVLSTCTEPLVDGAPDMRGLWRVVEVTRAGTPVPDHTAIGLVQRIEQCGNRVVITAGGIIHDMRADGTAENGVNDVAEGSGAPITVVATFEDGVHVLRPVGVPGVEVRRRIEDGNLVWDYVGFTARAERIGGPSDPVPA